MLIGNIAIGMSVDPAGMRPGLRSAQTQIQGFGASLGGIAAGLAGGAAAFGAFEFLKSGVGSAARLSEATATLNNLFGDSAKTITDAADAAAALGANKNEFLAGAGNFAAIFDGMGKSAADATAEGVKLAKLGQDLSADSLVGATSEEAFGALSAALRGEFDPLERFRVFLSAAKIEAKALEMGLVSAAGKLDDNAKKTATLALIYEQSSKSQGAFAREAGGATAQFRQAGSSIVNLATDLGTALMPAITGALGLFNEFVAGVRSGFEAIRPTVEGWVSTVSEAFATVGVLYRNLGLASDIVQIKAREFVINVGEGWAALMENSARLGGWFGTEWLNLLRDAFNGAVALLTNLGANFRDFGAAIVGWISDPTAGFQFNFTPLLDGFKATTAALPELARPAFTSLQGEIDALGGKMAAAETKRAEAKADAAAAAGKPGEDKPAEKKPEASGPAKFASLAAAGTAEAYKAVISATGLGKGSGIDKVAREAPQQTKLLAKIATGIDKMAAGPDLEMATL